MRHLGAYSGRRASSKWVGTAASIVSILASVPVALATFPTCRGLRATTGKHSAASADTKEVATPPVVWTIIREGAKSFGRLARELVSYVIIDNRSSFAIRAAGNVQLFFGCIHINKLSGTYKDYLWRQHWYRLLKVPCRVPLYRLEKFGMKQQTGYRKSTLPFSQWFTQSLFFTRVGSFPWLSWTI